MKGAIFDLDGTLINSLIFWNIFWESAGIRYFNKSGFMPTPEDDKAVRTMLLSDAMMLIHEKYKMAESSEELLDFCKESVSDFYKNTVKLKDGVLEFLEYMRDSGVKMCIASATEKSLVKLACERCGIKEYFSEILSCDDIGRGKDKPDIYEAALCSLGTDASETVVFEDSLIAIKTASALGLRCVGIYDRFNFGQEEIKALSVKYLSENESYTRFINEEIHTL
jgi:HAD superfamily hydrolase (TIGR01509 family)